MTNHTYLYNCIFLQPILDLVTEKMPAYDDIIRAMCDQQVDVFSKY